MRFVILLAVLVLTAQSASGVVVLTSRNTLGRTGVNDDEGTLTPARVNAQSFGKLWSLYADGQVVAQPLYVSSLPVDTSENQNIPRVQGTFNAVLIATMHNTVYLYDADHERPGPEGRTVPLWATWLGQPRPGGGDIDMFFTNDPEWGILSTPVIDPTKSTVYVVAWHDDGGGPQNYKYRLHALQLKDGTHLSPPVVLEAPGLNARLQKQRPGLLLTDGILYIAFGGDGSRGLLLAYDATTLTRKAIWVPTPTGTDGGLWQAGQAPAVDAEGNIYFMTGNGTFGSQGDSSNYGQSFVKLRLECDAFVVKDYFTPCNASYLNSQDMDLGSSGPVLIPGAEIVFGGGKEGQLYLLSTARMGEHVAPPQPNAATCPNPNVLQEFAPQELPDTGHDHHAGHHLHGSPVFWEGSDGARIYLWRENDKLRAYRFVNRRIAPEVQLSQQKAADGMPGGMLSLSSQAGTNGILWAVVPLNGDANRARGVKGIVLALDARDVSKQLWTSEQAGGRDHLGLFARFVPPTVADGKVFVATYGDDELLRQYGGQVRPQAFPNYRIVVYGMLPEAAPPVVDQTRDDVQLVRAAVQGTVTVDIARCRPDVSNTFDCTQELQRVAEAPSLERVTVPAGYNFAGCQLLRVTTATKNTALPDALGIGFYAADTTSAQLSSDRGRLIPKSEFKSVGDAVLKNGQPAVLHEFVATVNCEVAPGTAAGKQFKPYAEFVGGPPRTLYHNWDPITDNYAVGGQTTQLDRSAEVLQ
jgi:hypothetical protein